MFTGYATLNGTEVLNYDRTYAYLVGNASLGLTGRKPPWMTITDCGCPAALDLYCEDGSGPLGEYQTPALDDAPWYDANVPASADFLGLLPVDVSGFDATLKREVRDGAVLGGSLGPLRAGPRTLTFDGWLVAATCAAAEFGLGWLTEVLIGRGCTDCSMGDLFMLKGCPSTPPRVGSGSGGSGALSDAEEFYRYLYRVGLVSGPTVIERQGMCCDTGCSSCQGNLIHVQFTLASESPYIFGEVAWALDTSVFDTGTTYDFDFDIWCANCAETVGTQIVHQERPRSSLGVQLRHDGTWCPVDWDTAELGCPPTDYLLEVVEVVPFDGPQYATGGGVKTAQEIRIDTSSLTWESWGWDPAIDGFPSPYGEVWVRYANGFEVGPPGPGNTVHVCGSGDWIGLIRLIYNARTGAKTFETVDWIVPPYQYDCFEVIEYVLIPDTVESCDTDQVCEVTINCDGTWSPLNFTHDPDVGFPSNHCTAWFVPGQDTSNLIVDVEVPGNLFVPDCGPPPFLPPVTTFSTQDCFCEPWTSVRQCATLVNSHQWNEAAAVIVVTTGSSPLKNMRIAAYENQWADQGVVCPCDPADDFWRCKTPCAEIQVPELPSGATLTIDARTRSALIRFNTGIVENGLRYIQGPGGEPFDWFDLGPCGTYCVVVSADYTISDDATVSVGYAPRYLASGW